MVLYAIDPRNPSRAILGKPPRRPEGWPKNEREDLLEKLDRALTAFQRNPDYQTRDAVVNLACVYDFNNHNHLGYWRLSAYEIYKINDLYLRASHYAFTSLRVQLYELLAGFVHDCKFHEMSKCMMKQFGSVKVHVPNVRYGLFNRLYPPLKLFQQIYTEFVHDNQGRLSAYICNCVRGLVAELDGTPSLRIVAHSFMCMLTDLSGARGTKREEIITFTRDEIEQLLLLEFELIGKLGFNLSESPLKGMLNVQISNLILRSRNGSYAGPLYKSMRVADAAASLTNHQLWFRRVEKLNDERESRVVAELLSDASWLGCDWASILDLSFTRTYYAASFSRVPPDDKMAQKYGSCVYGFKSDKMTELIAPLEKRRWVCSALAKDGTEIAFEDCMNSQVAVFDILYDKKEAKRELAYLCSLVDKLCLSANKKRAFFEEILQYWILSVKDPEWSSECERRYVLFLLPDAEYKGLSVEGDFAKVKTTLLTCPDFILRDCPNWAVLGRNMESRWGLQNKRPYLYCHNCLNRDADVINVWMWAAPERCPICGSVDIEIVEKTVSWDKWHMHSRKERTK